MAAAEKMTLDELVTALRTMWSTSLRAIVLYGSAAAMDEHVPNRSDYNVLVVVDDLPLERLRSASEAAKRWAAAGNPAPLTLTTVEWRSSSDIFPMEYADILERHRVLHGDLPLDGIRVDPAHLRLQVEQQAMGKLLLLRQGILAAGADEGAQGQLLTASASTFMVLFRAVARLHGSPPPAGREALSRAVAELAGFDAEPFVRVVRHVRGEGRIAAGSVAETTAGYLRGAQQLVAHLDQFRSA